ncbi:thiol-disulfide oxidoreductase LTO1 isoform X1 [Primulina huaijiensis]|uniref:thiol-disulfide oxidoreductase LTO1 isoform X1 n=1 Tax=Primulina huaijiensis TaxID=1492673 RepID=UPI003CC70A15
MWTSAFFSSISSPCLPFHRTPSLSRPFYAHSIPRGKNGAWRREVLILRLNCVSERNKGAEPAQSEFQTTAPDPAPSESSSSYSSGNHGDDDTGISVYKWCTVLGGVGFLETAYLTYLKFTDSDAFCPVGEGSCTTILTSDYSYVFGVPLPLLGLLAYGLVASLSLQLDGKERGFDSGKSDGEIILLGTSTSMAVASAYFLYILSTEFSGELCLYCLTSAILSFSLFFITLKSFGTQHIQQRLGSLISISILVVIVLTASYNTAQPVSPSLTDMELPYFETKVTKKSSPVALSLARHLHSIGAKLYGAFWCSHCQDQKEMFGREASKLLDYVECFPDGVKKGNKMDQACLDVKIEGFPTWVINGQVLSGEKEFAELAELSGIKLEDLSQPKGKLFFP